MERKDQEAKAPAAEQSVIRVQQNAAAAQIIRCLDVEDGLSEIALGVTDQLESGDIISLSRTCCALSHTYRALLRTRWNVDRRLRTILANPKQFRTLLGQLGALVSGRFAYKFFAGIEAEALDQGPYPAMEVFVEGDEEAELLVKYLREKEGCGLIKETFIDRGVAGEETEYGTTKKIWKLSKCVGKDPECEHIDVLQTRCDPLTMLMVGAIWTTSLNIIGPRSAVSMFPARTGIQRKGNTIPFQHRDVDDNDEQDGTHWFCANAPAAWEPLPVRPENIRSNRLWTMTFDGPEPVADALSKKGNQIFRLRFDRDMDLRQGGSDRIRWLNFECRKGR